MARFCMLEWLVMFIRQLGMLLNVQCPEEKTNTEKGICPSGGR